MITHEIIYRGSFPKRIHLSDGTSIIQHRKTTITEQQLWELAPYVNKIAVLKTTDSGDESTESEPEPKFEFESVDVTDLPEKEDEEGS